MTKLRTREDDLLASWKGIFAGQVSSKADDVRLSRDPCRRDQGEVENGRQKEDQASMGKKERAKDAPEEKKKPESGVSDDTGRWESRQRKEEKGGKEAMLRGGREGGGYREILNNNDRTKSKEKNPNADGRY